MKNNVSEPIAIETMSQKEREKRIDELENERFSLTNKIEALMAEYIKVSGDKKLRRREKPGKSPNDYIQEKKR